MKLYNYSLNNGIFYFNYTKYTIKNTIFSYNTYGAGAISSNFSNTPAQPNTILNCIFNENIGYEGGAINLKNDNAIIQHNTFYDNTNTQQSTNSIYINNSSADIQNNIFYDFQLDLNTINSNNPQNVLFKNNLVNGGVSRVIISGSSVVIDTATIIDTIPYFVDEINNNFHLKPYSPCIDAGAITFPLLPDFDGKPRPWGNSLPDLGAFEFQGRKMYFEAGPDTNICDNKYKMIATIDSTLIGFWTIAQGYANIMNPNDPNTWIYDIAFGLNKFVLNVFDGMNYFTDTVIIDNLKPYADAGEDINLYSQFPNLITFTNISANAPQDPMYYYEGWSSDASMSFLDPSVANTQVSGLIKGINRLFWEVRNIEFVYCYTVDTLLIYVGYIADADSNGGDWNNPLLWGGFVPEFGDSVTIAGTTVNLNTTANCSSILISRGGTLNINGTSKAPSVLNSNKIYIEQNAEKFPQYRGLANLILSNGVINIDVPSYEGPKDYGLVIGSNAEVLLQPANATSVSEIHLGKGMQLVVEEGSHFKNQKGAANLTVSNGGKIIVEQVAEKYLNQKSLFNNVIVGTGGQIIIEQTAEKSASNTELRLTGGGRIIVEQSAEKRGVGGQISITGGQIIIEQSAEKSAGSNGGVYVDGGKIIVEQSAEKISDSSKLYAPIIKLLNGGTMTIGGLAKNRASANEVYSNKIIIEQNAEKMPIDTPALLIGSNSTVNILNAQNAGIIQYPNTAVTIYQGGQINLSDGAKYNLMQNASLIDYNPLSYLNGVVKINTLANQPEYFAPPFVSMNVDQLNDSIEPFAWNETNLMFETIPSGTLFSGGWGCILNSTINQFLDINGTFNAGDVTIMLKNTANGINLVGNPYTSSIIWDSVVLPTQVQSAIYLYDSVINNFKVYQPNGLSLYSNSPIIPSLKPFFVVCTQPQNLTFSSNCQTHNSNNTIKANSVENYLIFKVTDNNQVEDKLGFVFKTAANNNYETQYDALEIPIVEPNYVSLSSKSNDNKQLCIDTRPFPSASQVVNIVFLSNITGNFTLSLDQYNLNGTSEIKIRDVQNNITHDLLQTSSFTFNYYTPNTPKAFELITNGTIDVKELQTSPKVEIYNVGNVLYINAFENKIDNVQVYNVLGRKEIDKNLSSYSTVINTKLHGGVYIVRVNVNGNTYTKKIVF